MTYSKTYDIQKNNQLIINLPDSFKRKRKVKVTIEDFDDEKDIKIKLLKKASKDPLFLADVAETNADFESIDRETL
jgi:hypothetical protein